jgi:hypothetical protein
VDAEREKGFSYNELTKKIIFQKNSKEKKTLVKGIREQRI